MVAEWLNLLPPLTRMYGARPTTLRSLRHAPTPLQPVVSSEDPPHTVIEFLQLHSTDRRGIDG